MKYTEYLIKFRKLIEKDASFEEFNELYKEFYGKSLTTEQYVVIMSRESVEEFDDDYEYEEDDWDDYDSDDDDDSF